MMFRVYFYYSVSTSYLILCNDMDCSTPVSPVLHYHFVLLLPSIFPSLGVFSSESVLCIRWPKYWNFSFSINPSNEYSGLISFRTDQFALLAVKGNFKSLFQNHNLKTSILWCSAFFMAQLSHPYMTVGKAITFTIWSFFGKMMSLLFNTLSRFVITFPPRSKCLLISWLQSLSTVILEPKKICHCCHFFSIYWPWSDEARCHDLCFLMVTFKSAFKKN